MRNMRSDRHKFGMAIFAFVVLFATLLFVGFLSAETIPVSDDIEMVNSANLIAQTKHTQANSVNYTFSMDSRSGPTWASYEETSGGIGLFDSGIYVDIGDQIIINASGTFWNGYLTVPSPDGLHTPPDPTFGWTILPSIASNSLVGGIGQTMDEHFEALLDGGGTGVYSPGFVGSSFSSTAPKSGILFFAINDRPLGDNVDFLDVQVTIIPKSKSSDVYVNKEAWHSTKALHIDSNQIYNFSVTWTPGLWYINNLSTITFTVTTPMDLEYIDSYELYQHGTENGFNLPPTHIGQNYTWVLPLKDRFGSTFDLSTHETIQDMPYVDMVINTTDEDNYTRIDIALVPVAPYVSVNLIIKGQIINVSAYPPEFGIENLFSDYVNFCGGGDKLTQNQTYNFSILVDTPSHIDLCLETTSGEWTTKYSNTLTLPVSELGSVTVTSDSPVKWEYGLVQPRCYQNFWIKFD